MYQAALFTKEHIKHKLQRMIIVEKLNSVIYELVETKVVHLFARFGKGHKRASYLSPKIHITYSILLECRSF